MNSLSTVNSKHFLKSKPFKTTTSTLTGTYTKSALPINGFTICYFTDNGTIKFSTSTPVYYLIVAGGGSGGYWATGSMEGGGGGTVAIGYTDVVANTVYNVVIGAGGLTPGTSPTTNLPGNVGGSSSVFNITCGGGKGGSTSTVPTVTNGTNININGINTTMYSGANGATYNFGPFISSTIGVNGFYQFGGAGGGGRLWWW